MIPQSSTYNGVDVARIDDVDDGVVHYLPSPIEFQLTTLATLKKHCSAPAEKFAHFAHVAHFVTRNPKQKSIIRVSPVIDTMMNYELVPESAMLEEKTEIFGWRDLQDASETIAAFVRGMEKSIKRKY